MAQEAEQLRSDNAALRFERANLLKERQALLLRCERLALERANAQTGAGAHTQKKKATFRAQLHVSAY